MTLDDRKTPRPRSTEKPGVGANRHLLIKEAFAHAQSAIVDGYPIEAIAVIESILTDRLGGIVHGSLGEVVTLGDTLGRLVKLAIANRIVEAPEPRLGKSRRSELSLDVVAFARDALQPWWERRSDAVHAMAKLKPNTTHSFKARHDALVRVAIDGVRLVRALDKLDIAERQKNGAVRPATAPDGLELIPSFASRFPENPQAAS